MLFGGWDDLAGGRSVVHVLQCSMKPNAIFTISISQLTSLSGNCYVVVDIFTWLTHWPSHNYH